jgi:hypothetical protein
VFSPLERRSHSFVLSCIRCSGSDRIRVIHAEIYDDLRRLQDLYCCEVPILNSETQNTAHTFLASENKERDGVDSEPSQSKRRRTRHTRSASAAQGTSSSEPHI